MNDITRAKLIQKFGKANFGESIRLKRGVKKGKNIIKTPFKEDLVSAFNMARRI